ncbi:NADH-quinone oxidoreductase subunit C [Melioribacter sp. OK-6-Me]|uniref:NADH-quinone oxidoreductase subunit C n=1 Tax=unclassified Melioribacter TaxID=2627329 RepID=UPI003ED899E4
MDQKSITSKIKEKFGESVFEITEFRGDVSISVDPNKIVEIAEFLKNDDDLQFVMCKDITAIDWATRKNRFTVVYHVYSFKNNFNLRIKATISQDPPSIDSVTSVWRSANWYERETYDMYGINFRNHNDLRRIYMPEGFEYHPLRKEFPVLGIPGSLPLPEKPE